LAPDWTSGREGLETRSIVMGRVTRLKERRSPKLPRAASSEILSFPHPSAKR
jgi:hypothetical protein